MTLDLCGHEVVEDLRELGEVDVDQLSLQVQTQEREKVPFLDLNQLIVSLDNRQVPYTAREGRNSEK